MLSLCNRRLLAQITLLQFLAFLSFPYLAPLTHAKDAGSFSSEQTPVEQLLTNKDALIDSLFYVDADGHPQKINPTISIAGNTAMAAGTPYALTLDSGRIDLGFASKHMSIEPAPLYGTFNAANLTSTTAPYIEGTDGSSVSWEKSSVVYTDAYATGVHYGVVAKNHSVRKLVRFDNYPSSPQQETRIPFNITLDTATSISIGGDPWDGSNTVTYDGIHLTFSDGSSSTFEPAFVWDSNHNKQQIALALSLNDDGSVRLEKLIPRTFFDKATFPVFTDTVIGMNGERTSLPTQIKTFYIDVAPLSSTAFAMVYTYAYASNQHTNGSGTAIIGTLSGNDITLGSEVLFANGATATRVDALSSSKIVVVYGDAKNSGSGTAVIGSVSGNSVSFGTKATIPGTGGYGSDVDLALDVTALDSTSFAVGQWDSTSSTTTIVHGTVSGTNITLDSGDSATVSSNASDFISLASLDSSHVVGIFSDTTDEDITTFAAEWSGSAWSVGALTDAYTSNSAHLGNNNYHNYPIAIDDMSSTKFIALYRSENAATAQKKGQMVVGTVDASENITLGTAATFSTTAGANNRRSVGVAAVSDSQAVGVMGGGAGASQIRVADVTDTTIALGTRKRIDSGASNNVSIAPLNSTQVVVGYQHRFIYGGSGNIVIGVVGEDQVITGLPDGNTAVLSSDDTTDVTTNGQTGSQGIRLRHGGSCTADVTFDFDEGDHNFSQFNAQRNDSLFSAFVHRINGHSGISGDITLYIKKSANHDNLRYCSGKETIGCTSSDSWSALWDDQGNVVSTNGGFDTSDFTVSVVTVCSESLWRIVGPISSSGQGEGNTAVPEFSTWAMLLLLIGCGYVLHTHRDILANGHIGMKAI